ncbi:hypothetical protein [uncultured Hyphomicrobium sp.]|uniref:hypothetical protein n=1 Tax=uncultured Hyphomicrobium sp. TaxID=194373 RepID=UPI0025EF08BD|nr:hypothetical protein [uncultured Hyphomicrobium sp.]
MTRETLNKSLVKAADAAGYCMASREEDLTDWTVLQPEVALRNGHATAATTVRRMSLPFARFENWIAHMLSLSDIRVTPRALLPSR